VADEAIKRFGCELAGVFSRAPSRSAHLWEVAAISVQRRRKTTSDRREVQRSTRNGSVGATLGTTSRNFRMPQRSRCALTSNPGVGKPRDFHLDSAR